MTTDVTTDATMPGSSSEHAGKMTIHRLHIQNGHVILENLAGGGGQSLENCLLNGYVPVRERPHPEGGLLLFLQGQIGGPSTQHAFYIFTCSQGRTSFQHLAGFEGQTFGDCLAAGYVVTREVEYPKAQHNLVMILEKTG